MKTIYDSTSNIYVCVGVYIYIYTHTKDGKLSISCMQQTRDHWTLSVRKAAPWCTLIPPEICKWPAVELGIRYGQSNTNIFEDVNLRADSYWKPKTQSTSSCLAWSLAMMTLCLNSSSHMDTTYEGLHQVLRGGRALLNREGGSKKTQHLPIGFCTMLHKQENLVLVIRKFLQSYYL